MWIAFKNYYLRDEEQPFVGYANTIASCELLSKIIIFVTRNNVEYCRQDVVAVVNCFQKLLSSWRGTTILLKAQCHTLLWIAFKNYYLRDEEQLKLSIKDKDDSCELLSKIIIFLTRNNKQTLTTEMQTVVNCFQKLLSSWRGTTSLDIWWPIIPLWIAFKNYYLRDEEQQNMKPGTYNLGCELLSKIIIFVTRNNP